MKHNKKDCPLTIEMIGKQRQKYLNEARSIFNFLSAKEKQDLVAERTILYMDKSRHQTRLDSFNFGGKRVSLLLAPNEDLIDLSRFYSKLVSKTNDDRSLRQFYVGRMRIYTKELKSRGIDWKNDKL